MTTSIYVVWVASWYFVLVTNYDGPSKSYAFDVSAVSDKPESRVYDKLCAKLDKTEAFSEWLQSCIRKWNDERI